LAAVVAVVLVPVVGARAGIGPALSAAAGGRFGRLASAVRVERRLFGLLRPHRAAVAVGVALTVAHTVIGLARPWPTKILVDNVLGAHHASGAGRTAALAVAVALTVLLFLLGGAVTLWQTKLLYTLTQRIIADLRADLFRHLASLSLLFHDARGVGDNAYRVSADTYSIHSLLLGGVVPVVGAVLTLVGTFAVMVALDPVLAVLALVSIPAAAFLSARYGRRIRASSLAVHERESDVYAQAEQALTGIRTVQAFAREDYEAGRFRTRATGSQGAMVRLVTEQTVLGLGVDAVLAAGLALVTWFAAQRAISGRLSVGEVLVFLTYAGTVYGPVSDMAGVFGELQAAAAGAQRVFEVLDEPQPTERPGVRPPRARAAGALSFESVGFSYVPGHPVLRDIDLSVSAGETVALVGPTGAGKSSLANLLLRLYDPGAGRVALDGTDLRELPLAWLREQIALVPQDPVLFPGSVRDNIRYGRLDATDRQVEMAARRANVLDELVANPGGIDAPVGDRGVTLSGGQRQRVAIARAFLKDAPVLLLDEPTSALDAGTEVLIMEALWRLLEGRTCLVIAHRLSTVRRADRVVVVEGGRIVEQGSHASLIRRRGLYSRLHAARFGRGPGVIDLTTHRNGSERARGAAAGGRR
ncbi:MAG TPA: ABC transporter ATP-binding protein, partial [Acidimicrobiales bacterium]|nr:ABC transporter ATP-binding protein [Acidimicrobiales bacterium]